MSKDDDLKTLIAWRIPKNRRVSNGAWFVVLMLVFLAAFAVLAAVQFDFCKQRDEDATARECFSGKSGNSGNFKKR